MRQTTTAPAQGGPTELTKAELELVAGGVQPPVHVPLVGGGGTAVGAAASNTALVEQFNVFSVRRS